MVEIKSALIALLLDLLIEVVRRVRRKMLEKEVIESERTQEDGSPRVP